MHIQQNQFWVDGNEAKLGSAAGLKLKRTVIRSQKHLSLKGASSSFSRVSSVVKQEFVLNKLLVNSYGNVSMRTNLSLVRGYRATDWPTSQFQSVGVASSAQPGTDDQSELSWTFVMAVLMRQTLNLSLLSHDERRALSSALCRRVL